eukprot:TRINITY_DN8530_c0_g1_i1.p1 TRINITY_DN8530_c0_g1~~TRINITY_DN8530_c0_g1_i1.p1  ORF type:complete len:104 (+),score=17.04 TRINITY_DN8530_c0_g1_i1:116-427(+)
MDGAAAGSKPRSASDKPTAAVGQWNADIGFSGVPVGQLRVVTAQQCRASGAATAGVGCVNWEPRLGDKPDGDGQCTLYTEDTCASSSNTKWKRGTKCWRFSSS